MHLNKNEDEIPYGTAGYNSLFKIQPALDIIKKTFSECYRPGKNMSIDEAMVAFKGRTHLKQYLPSKPVNGASRFGPLQNYQQAISVTLIYTLVSGTDPQVMVWGMTL